MTIEMTQLSNAMTQENIKHVNHGRYIRVVDTNMNVSYDHSSEDYHLYSDLGCEEWEQTVPQVIAAVKFYINC